MTAHRIVICLSDFAHGGTERIAIRLAAGWCDLGRDVTILCGTEQGGLRPTVDKKIKVVAVDPPIPRGFLSRFRLGSAMARHLAELKPDVIFLPGNYHLFLAAGLRRGAPKAAIVLKISNPPLPGGLAGKAGRFLFARFTRSIDAFAALTSGFAEEVKALAPGKATSVLYDPVYLNPIPAAPRASGRVFEILWAGRLEPQKDVGLALRAMALLRGPAHLTLLGDGALREQVDAMIARQGLSDRVTRIGHVPGIEPYLAKADVLLMTSQYEGQPAVVGEALASGVPVVSTDCTSMLREVMTIPEAGRIVEGRDPAALAAALEALRDELPPPRERLAALTAPFEPRACARAYLDWFDTLHG